MGRPAPGLVRLAALPPSGGIDELLGAAHRNALRNHLRQQSITRTAEGYGDPRGDGFSEACPVDVERGKVVPWRLTTMMVSNRFGETAGEGRPVGSKDGPPVRNGVPLFPAESRSGGKRAVPDSELVNQLRDEESGPGVAQGDTD